MHLHSSLRAGALIGSRRRKIISFGLLAVLLLSPCVSADGFSYSAGHMIGEKTVFELNLLQRVSAHTMGIVHLTVPQQALLARRTGMDISWIGVWRRADVESWESCCCDVTNMGLLVPGGLLEVPHAELRDGAGISQGESFGLPIVVGIVAILIWVIVQAVLMGLRHQAKLAADLRA
jgi:hypothetical protein